MSSSNRSGFFLRLAFRTTYPVTAPAIATNSILKILLVPNISTPIIAPINYPAIHANTVYIFHVPGFNPLSAAIFPISLVRKIRAIISSIYKV